MAESQAQTAAGSKVYISPTKPATYDKAGFEALTWTEIGEVTSIPTFGKVYNIVNHSPIGDRQIIKRKGSYDNGSMDIPYAYDMSATPDAGQVLLLAALESDTSYSFWVDLKQLKAHYFTAQVTSAPTTADGVDSIIMKNSTLAIDNDVLEEAAP